MTAPFAKFIRLIVIASVSVFVLSESASVCHVEAGEDTQSIQARLDAASRRKLEVSKQIALKKAAVDVADKRVVQLQQQLEDSLQQLAADRKSLEAVTAS